MLNVFFLVSQNKFLGGFFGGSLVKNPPAHAGDTGLISDWEDPTYLGYLSCVPQLLSLCSRAGEPRLLRSPCARTAEAQAP